MEAKTDNITKANISRVENFDIEKYIYSLDMFLLAHNSRDK